MSNLQMIEALCLLCEEQARVLRSAVLRLAELGDVALKDEIAAADARYRELIGGGEIPDELTREEENQT